MKNFMESDIRKNVYDMVIGQIHNANLILLWLEWAAIVHDLKKWFDGVIKREKYWLGEIELVTKIVWRNFRSFTQLLHLYIVAFLWFGKTMSLNR